MSRYAAAHSGVPFPIARREAIGGGCINEAWRVSGGDGRSHFVKLNDAARAEMFARIRGLEEIHRAGAVRVRRCSAAARPPTRLAGAGDIALRGGGDAERLGRELAAMHRCTRAEHGWHRDNTIGATPQPNALAKDWTRFWQTRRLGHQLALANDAGYGKRLRGGERLLDALPALLAGHAPPASLLHGDLWSGNHAYAADGTPVIFDPAVYYGDRETDIAMTELFGGFPDAFHRAYRADYPLDAGYQVRKELYNLYHVLNHLNLFGGGYLPQAEAMIGRLLAELG